MKKELLIGIDVGSTTTKVAVVDEATHELLFSDYERHHADQVQSVKRALGLVEERFKEDAWHVVLTGSGAKLLSEKIEAPYMQEVVANSIALKSQYDYVNTAIELGGQDAKIIFFHTDEQGNLGVSDMRMNGSCAGGTGAFIDEVATLLKVPLNEFNELASQGTTVYDISGRCGVYAKTDIQPLLNQGVAKADIALSSFHAIAKQTIGGLAQGLEIKKPVAFEGGPITFNPMLVDVFKERLNLSDEDVLRPDKPEIIIAYGAALSLETMYTQEESLMDYETLIARLDKVQKDKSLLTSTQGKLYFNDINERENFKLSHQTQKIHRHVPKQGEVVKAYLGIDSGSTTTKFVLLSEDEEIIDSFYSPNEGDPLSVAKKALLALRKKYQDAGATLEILGAGTTGYGEMLFAKAFSTECHIVETVAHAKATAKYVDDASFILDIGGQDMKAIWIDHGVITNIVVNEACSSGCGSFLENFASTLHIPVTEIADNAFASQNPAALGSRCTVFMNSSIVSEQRNGKLPEDIMAGLCRSIIENVFTKVIRISNLSSLGDKIVVQGGTFENDAVLRAMEQYVGKPVTRAPYPGIMGAIGAALTVKEFVLEKQAQNVPEAQYKTFIGLDALDSFGYTQEANVTCPFCGNHCKRAIIHFSNGNSHVTNNRCERGEILGDPKDEKIRKQAADVIRKKDSVPNLFKTRRKLLFANYPIAEPKMQRDITIGIPQVLGFWELMPFWTTFFKSLGFKVKISRPSSHVLYERGLNAVTSDTVCFPAKLVHGHIRDLVEQKVDRIFFPSIAGFGSENTEKSSESMCAVVKGYPLVVKNSDNPTSQWGVPFDAPLFYWYRKEDRQKQLSEFMEETFGIDESETLRAVDAADSALDAFHRLLKEEGAKVIKQVEAEGCYAIVLASRPYHNDALVNHDLPDLFTEFGIPVLTTDSLPGLENVDLSKSRIDIANNYHARMLGSAILVAQNPHLEYVQLVSFGCGHDAYLSDEIIRLMKEVSGKIPLVLKLDESDVQGPLRIRVRSFIETTNMSRKVHQHLDVHELKDSYPQKYDEKAKKEKVALIPNTSHAFSQIMAAAFEAQGIKTESLELGRERAIYLGKKYVHNDICFPAQIVIGEALAALESGNYDQAQVAIGMGKYIGDCRLTHYTALLRKALDDAGYEDVPILTNDDVDYHNIHPAFKMSIMSSLKIAFALPMIDFYEEYLRKIRPYELEEGSANQAFDQAMEYLCEGIKKGFGAMKKGFRKGVELLNSVPYDRSHLKPKVLIVGEYLLNFHPGANHDIELYLEANGFEIVEARMTDVIRKTYFATDEQIQNFHLKKDAYTTIFTHVANHMFDIAHDFAESVAKHCPLYEKPARIYDLAKESDDIIPHTFDCGEGMLIPSEILHQAKHGCNAFIILQPFGCLPNHVVGRGVTKKLKQILPDAQILPLDYDPDVSFANIENRLQMLVMNVKEQMAERPK